MKNNLKSALLTAYQQELDTYPAQWELEQKYSFSHSFEVRMEDVIKFVNKTYISLFGIPVSRNGLVLVLAVAMVVPIGWLYRQGIIDHSSAKLIFAVCELILVSAFGVSVKSASRSLTRTYKNAITDTDDEEIPDRTGLPPLEFYTPVPPAGYSKTNEYRSSVDHTVDYTDSMGRSINYSCVNIKNGVLTKIDSAGCAIERLNINNLEAMAFIKNNRAHLVWADKQYRYYLQGDCTIEMLKEMADTITK